MKQHEKLLYQLNTFPSALVKLFLIFNTVQTILTLNGINVVVVGLRTMEIILLNIMLSFLVFINAAEIKRYSLRWSYIGLGTGIFQLIRILFISPTINAETRLIITGMLAISGILLIASCLLSIRNCKRYQIALKE